MFHMAPDVVEASGALLEQILDETFPIWGEGLAREAYGKYNRAQLGTPWGATHLRRLALADDGRLLATAKRYHLDARVDGRDVKLFGIGAVFTPEPLRRRGHATELLRRLLQSAADEGFDAALLFSEIDGRYYEHLGFRSLPVNQVALAVKPLARGGTPAISMRSGDAGDMASIVEMNRMQLGPYRFALRREADYVRHAIARKRLLAASGTPGHRTVEFFVVEEGGRAAAYVVLLVVGEFCMITECGDRDPTGARVGALLQAIAAREPARTVRLRAWLPPGFLPPQFEITAYEVPPVTMMMRPLGRGVWPALPLALPDIAWWHGDAF
jgi:GNAT superfamily N-acetyltransferase